MTHEPMAVEVRYLGDVPSALPLLARWFTEEWEPYYGPAGPGNAEADLKASCQRGAQSNKRQKCFTAVL